MHHPTLPDPATPDADSGSDAVAADALPTSFGVFKPVGHLMLGMPTQQQADAVVTALHGAGWLGAAVRHFRPRDSIADLQALVDHAGPLAGFGYEITLLRRYLALARDGYRWLLVRVDDDEGAAAATRVARVVGATLSVHYRALTVEELM